MPRRKPNNDVVKPVACLILAVLLGSGVLLKFTTFGAGLYVRDAMRSTRIEGERQANQPRVVITVSGQRIDCKRVLDQGKYWGLVLHDGKTSTIKKEHVREVIDVATSSVP